MTLMMRRLTLLGLACFALTLLCFVPNTAWADQDSGNGPVPALEQLATDADGTLNKNESGQEGAQATETDADSVIGQSGEGDKTRSSEESKEGVAKRGLADDAGGNNVKTDTASCATNEEAQNASVSAGVSSNRAANGEGHESQAALSTVGNKAEKQGQERQKVTSSTTKTKKTPATTPKPTTKTTAAPATKPAVKTPDAVKTTAETVKVTTKAPDAVSAKTASAKSASGGTKATKQGAIKDGVYIISSAKNPSRVLDVYGASKTAGANVLLWDDNGQGNQQWRIAFDAKTGNYTITSVHSGMALAFKSSSSGANVYQAKLTSSTRAIWSISKTSSGFVIFPAKNKGVALDVEGAAANAGDNIELWKANGKPWQRYWLVPVNPKISASKTLDNGVYAISLASSKGQKVDVEGASQGNAANVLLYHGNGGFNQRWYVSRDADNFYTITSVNSAKSLDIFGAGRVPGSNVIQYATHGRANQKWQIRDNGNGTYTVVSKLNGLALKASGSSDCANISVFADNGASTERFVFTKSKLVGDGIYDIATRQNLSKVVDVPGLSKKGGMQLALWERNSGMNQKYQLVDKGGETYAIQVAHSGKYLEDVGGKVVQNQKNGSNSQQWKATWSGAGIMLTNKATNRAITVSGSAKDGALLVTAVAKGNASQRFSFTKRNLIDGGLYTLRTGTGPRVLDVNAASKAQGANVQIWSSNDGNNQKFTITAVSGGYYKIVNLNSDKAVSAAGSSAGSNVRQATYSGSASQLWKAEVGPNGGVVFSDKQSGQALSVAGNANSNGANVKLAAKTGASGQSWTLVATKPHDTVLDKAISQAQSYGSNTDYFIAVDLDNHRTVVLRRSNGSWVSALNVTVSTGAPETPTVTGTFTIDSRGYSFGSGYTCYYWTQFYGDYLFHSVLYDEGTFNVQDGRLGMSISHGCVRMDIDDAYWIYNNIPSGTKVRVY